ncbi:ATP/GTP-binding protein family [Actinidia rufa]|uniref:ATP/GTP-binding protein family n=1 Tax=Actinidia rufa TaxID=165716 RepID=A0A7J0GJA7_9ERIC|nr:ATP/GTP-binding protein family [Actinidia rufa]
MILMSGLGQNAVEELSLEKSYDDCIPHFCNVMRFAVLKKYHSLMGIGGPWDTVDEGDPSVDDSSLVLNVLRSTKDVTQLDLKNYKHWNRKEWKNTGCTLMSDAWTDGKHRSITNFLVNSPRSSVFLKSIETSSIIKNTENLYELLDDLVKEIGEEHVVQVVIDSASAYVGAGKKLEEKRPNLFWSPCAGHCLDLMLSDIGELPVFKDTIDKAKEIFVFIYRHQWVLHLFRKFSKKRELTQPAIIRFATSYLTLKSFDETRVQLRAMFTSIAWVENYYSKTSGGLKVQGIVDDKRFWKAIKYCMKVVLPLVKVLRLMDGDAKPAMGYIYEAMDRAKEEIAKNVDHVKRRYENIWKIVDLRWDIQLHRPLHAAAHYFNPKFQYDENFKADHEIKLGLYKTIGRFFPDVDTKVKIDAQLEKFKKGRRHVWYKHGKIDKRKGATRTMVGEFWGRMQGTSMIGYKSAKPNMLDLRQEKRQERGETYDPICLSDLDSDDEWITEREHSCLPEDHSWMDIHECFQENEGTSGTKRKRGPRNLNTSTSKKDKKKVGDFLVDEDDDIEVIDDGEEEEEELDEGTMMEDDEDIEEELDLSDNE